MQTIILIPSFIMNKQVYSVIYSNIFQIKTGPF